MIFAGSLFALLAPAIICMRLYEYFRFVYQMAAYVTTRGRRVKKGESENPRMATSIQ